MIAATPTPPYYAVIFSSVRRQAAADEVAAAAATTPDPAITATTLTDPAGYDAMAQRMLELAARQPGFLGVESARDALGITVSYWASLESIHAWKLQVDHLEAQRRGRSDWYRAYCTRICLVEREYGFDAE